MMDITVIKDQLSEAIDDFYIAYKKYHEVNKKDEYYYCVMDEALRQICVKFTQNRAYFNVAAIRTVEGQKCTILFEVIPLFVHKWTQFRIIILQ